MDIEVRLTEPGEAFAVAGEVIEAETGDVLMHIEDEGDHHTILLEPEQARGLALALMNTGARGLVARHGSVGALRLMLTGKSHTQPEIMDPDHA